MAALSTIAAVAAIAGTAYSVHQGEKSAKLQSRAMAQAEKAAQADAAERDMAFNKANQKRPRALDSLMQANLKASGGAQSGTMLTGPQGVGDPLALGKSTLLGG